MDDKDILSLYSGEEQTRLKSIMASYSNDKKLGENVGQYLCRALNDQSLKGVISNNGFSLANEDLTINLYAVSMYSTLFDEDLKDWNNIFRTRYAQHASAQFYLFSMLTRVLAGKDSEHEVKVISAAHPSIQVPQV
jgi:hypothetical protein